MHLSMLASHIHPYTLNDKGIQALLDSKQLNIEPPLQDDQLQPATLDVRIGRVRVYDKESWIRQALEKVQTVDMHGNPVNIHAKVYDDVPDIPILIPPTSFVEMEFHEKLTFNPHNYYFTTELRSGRGRLAFQSTEDLMPKWASKMDFWNNNPKPILLYGQSKFAQLFFHPRYAHLPRNGEIVNNPDEVWEIAKQVCGKHALTIGSYMLFKMGEHLTTFRENIGIIDTKNISGSIYQKVSTKNRIFLYPNQPAIVQLLPEVSLPDNIGIRLLHQIPMAQGMQTSYALDSGVVNAGWVDPGYQGKITAHPFRRITPQSFQLGDNIAVGVIYKYSEAANRAYGSNELNSHYQNSDGTTTKD